MSTAASSLTQQQRQAIETRNVSIGLSAGAGSGKTYVLTRRFLSYLEPGPDCCDLGSLVAITFTERAAREMRTRIREECARRLQTCPTEEVPHWLQLVRDLDSARVETIHGFCGSILRANAVEARLDPRFTLLDDISGSTLRTNAVRTAVRQQLAVQDPDFMELVFEFGLEKTVEILDKLVLQRFRIDFHEWSEVAPATLVERWRTMWQQEAIPGIMNQFAKSPLVKETIDLLRKNPPATRVLQERCSYLLANLPRLSSHKGDPKALLHEINENAKVQAQGLKNAWDEATKNRIKSKFEEVREALKEPLKLLEVDMTHIDLAAATGLRALRATRHAVQEYEARKQDAGSLDFDDLLLRTRNLLRDFPEVRRRAAAGISLLMVDEFQDTDPVQAQIVRDLCGEQLLTGRLFLVGDHKQSIYRFRRAEPRVFHELRQELPEAGRLSLSMNFRSQPAILNFVNALFEDVLGPAYEPLVPHFAQLTPQPAIEFLFSTVDEDLAVAGRDEGSHDESAWGEGVDDETTPARRATEADWIARRLQCLLHDGVPRIRHRNKTTGEDELRAVEPRDIVLLFRSMSDVRYYEEALRNYHLDYYVVGGYAFYAQQEVYDLVNLCRFLDDADDQISLAGVLRSPFFAVSDDGLYAMVAESGTLSAALLSPAPNDLDAADRGQIEHARRVLAELRAKKDRLPLYDLLNLALDRTGYDAAVLAEFLGARKLANLRKLIEMARQFDRAGTSTLADFVTQLRDAVKDEAREPLAATHPESSNVIRLMTIHQSKGLEFPVVVLTDMDRRANNQMPLAAFDTRLGPLVPLGSKFGDRRQNPGAEMFQLFDEPQSLAEAHRLLYVATTRAADMLLLSARMLTGGMLSHPWMKLLASRFDLQSGQPKIELLAKHSSSLPEIRVHHVPPEIVPLGPREKTARHIGLAALRDSLDGVEPAPLPPTMTIMPVDATAIRRFNVSQIEQADQELEFSHSPGRRPSGGLFSVRESELGKIRLVQHGGTIAPPAALGFRGRDAEMLGNIVHLVLERIEFGSPHNLESLVEAAILSPDIAVSEAVRREAHRCLRELLESPLARELANAKVCHRELEFMLHWPQPGTNGGTVQRLVTGTLDGLYEAANGQWILFDYKTRGLRGDPQAAAAKVAAHYEVQLGIYCLATRHLLDRLPDRVELVLLRDGVHRVTFKPTEAFVNSIAHRVHAALDHLAIQAST